MVFMRVMVTTKLMIMRRKITQGHSGGEAENSGRIGPPNTPKEGTQGDDSDCGAEVLAEASEDEAAAADDEGQIEDDFQSFGGVVVSTFGVFPEFYAAIRRFRPGKKAMQEIAPVIEEIVKEQGGGQQGYGDGDGKDHFFSGKQTVFKM